MILERDDWAGHFSVIEPVRVRMRPQRKTTGAHLSRPVVPLMWKSMRAIWRWRVRARGTRHRHVKVR